MDNPKIVLVYCGFLIDDNSPLLDDHEWLDKVSNSTDEDGDPLFHLAVHPCLTGQAAVDYIKSR